MSDALKPCPFCGANPTGPTKTTPFGGCDERNGYNFTVQIRCHGCGATVSTDSSRDKSGWCNDTGQAMSKAVATWNTRQHAEIEALRKDAARYRWLRIQDDDNFEFAVVKNPHFDVYDSPHELDAAIDTAMENTK